MRLSWRVWTARQAGRAERRGPNPAQGTRILAIAMQPPRAISAPAAPLAPLALGSAARQSSVDTQRLPRRDCLTPDLPSTHKQAACVASCSGSSTRAVVASKQQSSQLDHVPPRWQPGPGGGGSSSGASNARGAAAARCPGDGEAVGQSVVCTCVGVGVGWSLGRACTSARARAALRVYCVWALFACGRRTAQSQLNCWSALIPPYRPRTAASHLNLTTPQLSTTLSGPSPPRPARGRLRSTRRCSRRTRTSTRSSRRRRCGSATRSC